MNIFHNMATLIRTLPRALRALGSRAYISVKPLAAVLQYINISLVIMYLHQL